MAKDLLGTTLAGRYRFDANSGEGTFAKVYRVHDTRRSVDLAAKVLRTDIAHDVNFTQRFRREAEVLARLQHPNIVRYYDLVEAEDYVFILMEYVEGQTLQSTIYRLGKPFIAREALEFVRPLSAALHFAHGEGVIHRDLKPANVLIHENGNLYVTDFGIARILDDAAMSLTAGRVLGTPLYMAPEQIMGEPATAATDIYALGVMLYQMLTNRVPFDGTHPDAKGDTVSERVTYEHLNIPPIPLRQFSERIEPSVEALVMRCLAKDVHRRPATVREVYDLMAEAVGKISAAFDEITSESTFAIAPPNAKLPEVSQLNVSVPALHNGITVLPSIATADKTVEVPNDNDPSSTQKSPPPRHSSEPIVPVPAPMPVAAIPPAYFQPKYGEAFEDENLGFDPMRFLLIGVAIAMLACVGLVIYAIDPFGTEDSIEETPTAETTATNITPEASSIVNLTPAPTGSSDGNLIVYASRRLEPLQIFTMNSDGTDERHLLDDESFQHQGPAWSPDGSKIAFYGFVNNASPAADIYVINADGTGLINLTDTPNYDDRYPSWSPDGRYIAFHSDQPDATGTRDFEIYRLDLATGKQEQLTQNNVIDYSPDYSPDGSSIIYLSYPKSIAYIYQMDADGKNHHQLSSNEIEGDALYPTWSPDGSQIAFHVEMSPRVFQIYIMNANGSRAQPLMETYVNDQFPDWSPDGDYLVFQRVENNTPKIYRYHFEDGTLEQLGEGLGDFHPDWQPIY